MRGLGAVLAVAAVVLAGCGERTGLTQAQSCYVGAYRFADGRSLDITASEDGDLRWRLLDGRTGRLAADRNWSSTLGWTDRPDDVRVTFGGCGESARVGFADTAGPPVEGSRLKLDVRETTFRSGDVLLKGRLVLPAGSSPVPLIVEVHGSEKDSALTYNFRQRLFPAEGVGVFVYDKRGTGGSEGKYTQDFKLLAQDAGAALREARRLAGSRVQRIGFAGGSQAGWIIPLAANLTRPDFSVVGYGLADSPFAENRDEALQDVEEFGPEVTPKALEVIAATEAVMASNFQSGYERIAAVKRKYGQEPWFGSLKGEFTGDLLKYPAVALKVIGPRRNVQTPWTHDPLPALRSQKAPLLWVLAGDDSSAPVAETRRRLMRVNAEGAPITVIEFPRTEHGVIEYEEGPDGERLETGYAEGWMQAVLDWARNGRLGERAYGDSVRLTQEPRENADAASEG